MRRRGIAFSAVALLLSVVLISVSFYYATLIVNIDSSKTHEAKLEGSIDRVKSVEEYFYSMFENAADNAVLSVNQYVVDNGFVSRAPDAILEALKYGKIEGRGYPPASREYLQDSFNDLVAYADALGLSIEPQTPAGLVNNLEAYVYVLDSFHLVFKYRLKNVVIKDKNTGEVLYEGNFPATGYKYYIVSIEGLTDPYIARLTNKEIMYDINPAPARSGKYSLLEFTQFVLEKRHFAMDNAPTYFAYLEGTTARDSTYKSQAVTIRNEIGWAFTKRGYALFVGVDVDVFPEVYEYFVENRITPEQNVASSEYYFFGYYAGRLSTKNGVDVEGIGIDYFYMRSNEISELLG